MRGIGRFSDAKPCCLCFVTPPGLPVSDFKVCVFVFGFHVWLLPQLLKTQTLRTLNARDR